MIEMLPAPAQDIVALKIKGDVDQPSVERVGATIDRKLASNESLRMYAEIDDLGDVGADAILEDMQLAVRHGKRFRRTAIVSDKKWLEVATKASDKLWPKASVQHFGYGEQDDAMQWLLAG